MESLKSVLLSNRFKSFYWRTGMMALSGFISLILSSLSDFNMGTTATVVLGLVLGEVSKYLNQYLSQDVPLG